jgi:glucose-6-phosphate 1-dehydrogenase
LQVEKPFGKDLASSRELQKSLEPDWKEDELYRIDHYLVRICFRAGDPTDPNTDEI